MCDLSLQAQWGTKEPLCWIPLKTDGNAAICQSFNLLLLADPPYPSQTFRIFFANQPKADVVGVGGDEQKGGSLSPTPLEFSRSLAKKGPRQG